LIRIEVGRTRATFDGVRIRCPDGRLRAKLQDAVDSARDAVTGADPYPALTLAEAAAKAVGGRVLEPVPDLRQAFDPNVDY